MLGERETWITSTVRKVRMGRLQTSGAVGDAIIMGLKFCVDFEVNWTSK